MLTVALTGGICSGKTTACDLIVERFGVPLIDADQITHQMIAIGEPGYAKVVDEFGESILNEKGEIDRTKLGEKVFADQQLRERLNRLLHPLILEEIQKSVQVYRKQKSPVVLISIALLLEAGIQHDFNPLILILSNPDLQIKRLIEKRGLTRLQAVQRIESQWSNEKRIKIKECFKIWNNGGLLEFQTTVIRVWEEIIREHREKR
jgi:dephospho-CoA kinase